MNSIVLNRIALVLAFIGVFIAGALSVGDIFGISVPCGQSGGCEAVASHPSSAWFGVRVAYIGLAAYTAIALLTVLRMQFKLPRLWVIGAFVVTGVGAAIHVGLAIYAYTVIQKTCYWCLASMITMVVLFLVHAAIAQAESMNLKPRADLVFALAMSILCVGGLGSEGWYQWNNAGKIKIDFVAMKKMTLERLVPEWAHVYGEKDAPITVVEFADLYCSACKRKYPDVKKLADGSHGKIRIVFKHLPLVEVPGHELSWTASMFSECAAEKGKFWTFVDSLYADPFEQHPQMEVLLNHVRAVGLNPEDVQKRALDKTDPAFDHAYQDLAIASELGIEVTPMYIIMAPGMEPQAANGNTLEMVLRQKGYQKFLR